MIKASLAQQSRDFEQRMLVHARKLVAAHFEKRRSSAAAAWRDPRLLWPNFTQD